MTSLWRKYEKHTYATHFTVDTESSTEANVFLPGKTNLKQAHGNGLFGLLACFLFNASYTLSYFLSSKKLLFALILLLAPQDSVNIPL